MEAARLENIPDPLAKLFAKAELGPDLLDGSRAGRLLLLPYSLVRFKEAWQDWCRFEPLVDSYADDLLGCLKDPAKVIAVACDALGIHAEPIPFVPGADLLTAILGLGGVSEFEVDDLARAIEIIPRDIATAAAEALSAIGLAVNHVRSALPWRIATSDVAAEADVQEALRFATKYALGPSCGFFLEKSDIGRLAVAAELVAQATERARALPPSVEKFRFEWKSPLGQIVIAGGGAHHHDLQDALFVLDVGRANVYFGGLPGSQPVAIVIDGGGSQFLDIGATVFGITEFFVQTGCNRFVSKRSGTDVGGAGGAAFGVSLIHCTGGSNEFDSRTLCQGAAVCGIAAVLTEGGENVYRCHSNSQGFGGVRGFGCLVDSDGGCQYIAEDSFLHNPAPQTPGKHNVSTSQGVGLGFRGAPGAFTDMAGGFGFLVNGGGGNQFRCAVFGQGAGYLLGLGALVVRGSSNDFGGVYYVQGSAAHYALGCLSVRGGQNRFHADQDQSQGAGVDFAIGLMHCTGNDSAFSGGSGRLGMGIENGIGICICEGDSNRYDRPAKGLGYAEDCGHGKNVSCFGLFAYDGPHQALNLETGTLSWQAHPTPKVPLCGVSWRVSQLDL